MTTDIINFVFSIYYDHKICTVSPKQIQISTNLILITPDNYFSGTLFVKRKLLFFYVESSTRCYLISFISMR